MKSTMEIGKERTERILLSLDKLGFLSRSQIQEMHDLKSDRNAQRVLKNMRKYLNVERLEENVYYLNKTGRSYIGSDKVYTKSQQIRHILLRNQLYIYLKCPTHWDIEKEVILNGKFYVKPDVLFTTDRLYFAEIDVTQKMSVNKAKIEQYARMKDTKMFHVEYGYFPKLIWVTKTKVKKERLIQLCREKGLQHVVYTQADIT